MDQVFKLIDSTAGFIFNDKSESSNAKADEASNFLMNFALAGLESASCNELKQIVKLQEANTI